MGVTPRSRRTSSGIPRSTGPSRETSPNRYSGGYGQRRIGTGRSGITPDRPPKRPQMTEKILKQSLEAETALAEALVRILHIKGSIIFGFLPPKESMYNIVVFLFRKAPLEKTPERTHMDCLMTVIDQTKAKHLVSVLKDHIQTSDEDLVME